MAILLCCQSGAVRLKEKILAAAIAIITTFERKDAGWSPRPASQALAKLEDVPGKGQARVGVKRCCRPDGGNITEEDELLHSQAQHLEASQLERLGKGVWGVHVAV